MQSSFLQRRRARRGQLRQPRLPSRGRLLGGSPPGRAGCWALLPLLGRRLLGAAATKRALARPETGYKLLAKFPLSPKPSPRERTRGMKNQVLNRNQVFN